MGWYEKLGRALRLLEEPVENASLVKQVTLHVEETGSSGTEIYSGYYSEEYLNTLRGTQAADLWDQMRRSDPKIKMVLSAVKNPIKGAHWSIEPADASDAAKKQADLIEQILFKDLDQSWTNQLGEILTFIDFGFSVFEVIHKIVTNHPKFGMYTGLSKLAFRSPRTIDRWNLDPKTGKLLSVSQYAYGDLQRLVDIPGQFLLVFTHEKEGDNYEGISGLRPCYGPWIRKNTYLKLMAIGMEKFAVPTPVMSVPEGKENSTEYSNAKRILEKFVSHQQQYITKPQGWELTFANSTFDATKIRDAIDKENSEMAFAFLENFLELGQSGSGSYALGTDLSDFFLMGIEHVGNLIAESFNRVLIPDLIKLNFGPQENYPKLTVSGITDKPGKEFAEVVKLLADAKVITPDPELEKNLREKYGLPVASLETDASVDSIPILSTDPETPKLSFQLAEKPKTPKALISARTQDLSLIMKGMLAEVGKSVIDQLMAKKKRATPSQYLNLTNGIQAQGSRAYEKQLKDFLSLLSQESLTQAKKEIPGGSQIQLAEENSGHLKLASSSDLYDPLPPEIQKQITAQIGLLTTFQIQDLLKGLFFQFNNSVTSTDSDTTLEADLNERLDQFLEGASIAAGAGNTVSKIVNESRSCFFFDPEVIEEIESFTFVNGDPVSPICQDLAGTVFSKDDPNMDRYSPPLHHNCKSYLVPNLKGTTKEMDPEGLQPSKASLEKYITLSDLSSGKFVLHKIVVSKKIAESMEAAKVLASEVTSLESPLSTVEVETGYVFELTNLAMMEEGSLKSFEPMEGVIVFYGRSLKLS